MALAPELKEITRNISSEMGGVVGNIRKTASDNQKMFSVILKDIGKHFEVQNNGLTEVSESVEQSSNKVAAKVDSTNSLLQDSLGLLSNTYAELRTMNSNIKVMNNNLGDNNKSLLERLGSGFKGLQNVILGAAASAAPAMLGLAGGMAGSFGTDIFGGKANPMDHNGSSSEAMSFFQSKGWSKEQSAGIVGNLQVESDNFSSDVISGRRKGDGGQAVGIAQWHPDRQARFQQVMGKPIAGSSFKEQLAFVDWELKNSESKAGDILKSKTDASSAASAVDEFYERSSGEHRAKRIANAVSLSDQKSDVTPVSGGSGSTPKADATPASKPEPITPGSAEQAESTKEHNGHSGHEGIISGKTKERSADAGKVTQSQSGTRNMPINDRLLGVLQKAASEAGVAVDITSGAQPNYPQGPRTGSTRHDIGVGAADLDLMQNGRVLTDHNPEDVKVKRKFVEAAAAAGATGIGAGEGYMGASKIHVGFGKPATWGGAGWLSGLNLGSATSPESEKGTSGATPYSGGSAVTPGMGGGSYDQRLAAIQENINKLGGGVTGIGAEESSAPVGPSLESLQMGIPAHGMMGAPVNMQSFIENLKSQAVPPAPSPTASMVPTPAVTPSQTIEQSRINDEIEDYEQKQKMVAFAEQTKKQTTDIISNQNSSGTPSSFDYNNAADTGWPDWAALIGGWNWEETKKIKQNMHF